MKLAVAIGVGVLVAACGMSERAPVAVVDHSPPWALDPAVPGGDLPPAGRSLFDFALARHVNGEDSYDIPPTFDELLGRIERGLGCDGGCSRQVLIPLGRSLQRTAASPGFFSSPRVVVAITGDGAGPISGRDRIYLGYQRRAGTIEVISYNEAAGRFEFQLVTGYRSGGTPQLVYAKRSVCVACHQNHGPIFSRQVWDETNANPRIAALLNEANPTFERIPVETPNAIDDATERANLIGVTQRLWMEACDPSCRRAALIAALQFRLSGGRGFDREPIAKLIAGGMRTHFPDGLAIPNPDIPNRDPLDMSAGISGRAQSHVSARLEALVPRAPLDVWRADDPELAHRFVTGLAQLLSAADIRAIDERISSRSPTPTHIYRAPCTLVAGNANSPYECRGEVVLSGNASVVSLLSIGDAMPLRNLSVADARRKSGRFEFSPRSGVGYARLASGDAVSRVSLRGRGDQGEVEVTVVEDFSILREGLSSATFPDRPFSRATVMAAVDAALDVSPALRCCEDGASLPPAKTETPEANTLPLEAAAFKDPCGRCHGTTQTSPPNFLAGDEKRVSTLLAHCAPRIFVRLAMWDVPADLRDKVPMPPPAASRAGHPWVQESPPESVAPLRKYVAGLLRTETGAEPDVANLLLHGYENMRTCLPAGT